MKKIVFINGKYHAEFNLFDVNSFLNSFCINQGVLLEEASLFDPPTEVELAQLNTSLQANEGSLMRYVDGKAQVVSDDAEEVILEIQLGQS